MKAQTPIREGLFEKKGDEATLVGSRCASCGAVFFPPKNVCLGCLGKEMEPLSLGGKGSLYSFSIVHMPAEHYKAPYAVGWVELPNGMRVFTQLRGWEGRELKIGMGMTMTIEKLWEEEEREIIGYSFRPEGSGSNI